MPIKPKTKEKMDEPGGAKLGEYMHEWLREDAVLLDLPAEEIIGALARDNKLLKDKLRTQPEITEKDLQAWADEAESRVEDEKHWSPLFDVMKEMLEELGVRVIK